MKNKHYEDYPFTVDFRWANFEPFIPSEHEKIMEQYSELKQILADNDIDYAYNNMAFKIDGITHTTFYFKTEADAVFFKLHYNK